MALQQASPKKIYIRVDEWWQPWANTVAYFPFDTDTLDTQGNITLSWSFTKSGLGYIPTSSSSWAYSTTRPLAFFNAWFNIQSYSGNYVWMWLSTYRSNNFCAGGYYIKHADAPLNHHFFNRIANDFTLGNTSDWQPSTSNWHNVSFWWDGSNYKVSADGVPSVLWTWNTGRSLSDNQFWLDSWDYIVSRLIIEDAVWTDQEVLDYYNQTKWIYWIS